jgi:hypothetical protein
MYYGALGIVGLVKPTYRPGSMESFIKLMPVYGRGTNRSFKKL